MADTDTVEYPVGSPVWIYGFRQKTKLGTVTGHHPKSGKPMVKWPGIENPRPLSKTRLRLYVEGEHP